MEPDVNKLSIMPGGQIPESQIKRKAREALWLVGNEAKLDKRTFSPDATSLIQLRESKTSRANLTNAFKIFKCCVTGKYGLNIMKSFSSPFIVVKTLWTNRYSFWCCYAKAAYW